MIIGIIHQENVCTLEYGKITGTNVNTLNGVKIRGIKMKRIVDIPDIYDGLEGMYSTEDAVRAWNYIRRSKPLDELVQKIESIPTETNQSDGITCYGFVPRTLNSYKEELMKIIHDYLD